MNNPLRNRAQTKGMGLRHSLFSVCKNSVCFLNYCYYCALFSFSAVKKKRYRPGLSVFLHWVSSIK